MTTHDYLIHVATNVDEQGYALIDSRDTVNFYQAALTEAEKEACRRLNTALGPSILKRVYVVDIVTEYQNATEA